jgi:hypothetical protein
MSEIDAILGAAADRWKSATDETIQLSRQKIVSSTSPSSVLTNIIIGISIVTSIVVAMFTVPALFTSGDVDPTQPHASEPTVVVPQHQTRPDEPAAATPARTTAPTSAAVSAETLELRRRSSSPSLVQLEHRADSLVGVRPAEAASRYVALVNQYQRAGDSTAVRRLRAKASKALLPTQP